MKEILEELLDTIEVDKDLELYLSIFAIWLAVTVFGVLGGVCLILTMLKARTILLLIPILVSVICELGMIGLAAIYMCFISILIERSQDE